MSDQPKLPGGKRAEEELTRLKYYWRDVLTPAQKDFWRSRFNSKDTQAAVRDEMRVKLKFELKYDKQLTRFRKWDELQQDLDDEAQQQLDDERRFLEQHPDWDADRLRTEVISASYRRSLAHGDFKLGLKTIAQDAKLESLAFDKEKFKEGLRTKLESAFNELAQHIKGNAAAQAAYDAFKSTIKETTK